MWTKIRLAFQKKNYLFYFINGFWLGLLPSLILYLNDDPSSSFWSIVPGIFFGLLAILFLSIYKKQRRLGIIILIMLIALYIYYILLIFGLYEGFMGGFP